LIVALAKECSTLFGVF